MSTRRSHGWILLLALAGAGIASAQGFDELQVHGFATQGYIETSDNRFFGDSQDGSLDFRELGINATLQATLDLRLSGQLLSRKAGDMYSASPTVDFALADLTLRSTPENGVNLLVGRLKNPLGLYNETRDVAFTRPGVFVPQVVYFDRVRNLLLSFDGAALNTNWFGELATVNLFVAAGQPRVDKNVEATYLGWDLLGELEPQDLAFSGRLLIESPDQRLRVALSAASTSMKFESRAFDPIGDGDIDVFYAIASLQYVYGDLTLTTEYMREPIEWKGFPGRVGGEDTLETEGYYFQAQLQIRDDVELLARYEEGFADRNDRSGRAMEYRTAGFLPAYMAYSKILTAGVRWDISPNLMLRAEYQRHDGTFILSNIENPVPGQHVRDWDLFALSVSYRF